MALHTGACRPGGKADLLVSSLVSRTVNYWNISSYTPCFCLLKSASEMTFSYLLNASPIVEYDSVEMGNLFYSFLTQIIFHECFIYYRII